MRVVHSERHRAHVPAVDVQAGVAVAHVEVPERAERIRDTLESDTTFTLEEPTDHGLTPIAAVHAEGMVRFLQAELDQLPDTILHPALRDGMPPLEQEPEDQTGRLGYWCFDTGTPLNRGTLAAARSAVDVALTATDLVLNGTARAAYGLCRPPGHHAAHAVYGGFCYFNNAAIAAQYIVDHAGERVAILDLDYHHGNGTQQIFYRRADVLYVSVHADPHRAYPYFTGYADETGAGPGLGATLNIPLPIATTDARYLDALDKAVETLDAFNPGVTIVSLGIDTYQHDPLGDFALTTAAYATCGQRVAEAAQRIVVLQEGGYYLPDLGENVRQFLLGAERIQ